MQAREQSDSEGALGLGGNFEPECMPLGDRWRPTEDSMRCQMKREWRGKEGGEEGKREQKRGKGTRGGARVRERVGGGRGKTGERPVVVLSCCTVWCGAGIKESGLS